MSPGDWLTDGTSWAEPEPAPLARVARRMVEAICCPACQALGVHQRDNGKRAGQVRWVCDGCGHAWWEPDALAPVRGYVVG